MPRPSTRYSASSLLRSVNLDGSINPVHKYPARKETNGTCNHRQHASGLTGVVGKGGPDKLTSQDEEQEADQQTVAHVKHSTSNAPKAQLADPVQERIGKHVECTGPSCAERSPLPVVVLTTQQEVDQQDCDGSASDDHDAIAEEEEAEHVVYFAKPHVVHDKVELDEDGAEREDADKSHGGKGAEICC